MKISSTVPTTVDQTWFTEETPFSAIRHVNLRNMKFYMSEYLSTAKESTLHLTAITVVYGLNSWSSISGWNCNRCRLSAAVLI
jgi:hypothetical protein